MFFANIWTTQFVFPKQCHALHGVYSGFNHPPNIKDTMMNMNHRVYVHINHQQTDISNHGHLKPSFPTWPEKPQHKSINILQATLFRVELGAIDLNQTGLFGQVILVGPRKNVPPLKRTCSLLKIDGWNITFLLGRPIFRGDLLVSGRLQKSATHRKRSPLPKNEWTSA